MSAPSTRALAAVLGAVVVVAAAAVVWANSGDDDKRTAAAPRTPVRTSSAPTSTATPSPTPTTPAVPHDRVRAARPTAFAISGPGFSIKAKVCAMAPVVPLDPPGDQHGTVCWVRSKYGVAPGSDSATSYVLGHSFAQDPREVLNKMSVRATDQLLKAKPRTVNGAKTYPVTNLNGYRVMLRNKYGTLNYVVRSAYGVRKADLPYMTPTWHQQTKKRVVLITCAQHGGRDYDYNVVVDAYLVSSKASKV